MAKKKATVPHDQPTRQNIRDLLKRMDLNNVAGWRHPKLRELSDKIDARQKEVLDADEVLKELNAEYSATQKETDKLFDARKKRIDALRLLFMAEGVTPQVVRRVQALVAELFPETVETTNADSASADAIGGADGAQLI